MRAGGDVYTIYRVSRRLAPVSRIDQRKPGTRSPDLEFKCLIVMSAVNAELGLFGARRGSVAGRFGKRQRRRKDGEDGRDQVISQHDSDRINRYRRANRPGHARHDHHSR